MYLVLCFILLPAALFNPKNKQGTENTASSSHARRKDDALPYLNFFGHHFPACGFPLKIKRTVLSNYCSMIAVVEKCYIWQEISQYSLTLKITIPIMLNIGLSLMVNGSNMIFDRTSWKPDSLVVLCLESIKRRLPQASKQTLAYEADRLCSKAKKGLILKMFIQWVKNYCSRCTLS